MFTHTHSALLCNYCVLVLSLLNVTMCALEQRLVKREKGLLLRVYMHLMVFAFSVDVFRGCLQDFTLSEKNVLLI